MRLIDTDVIIRDLTGMKSQYDAIELDGMIKALKKAPTIEAAPVVHARWEFFGDHGMSVVYQCTHCGFRRVESLISAYCPNCGAKMDGKAVN